MRILRRFVPICLALSMVVVTGQGVSAKPISIGMETQQRLNIINNSTRISDNDAGRFLDSIQQKLINQYNEDYKLDNFRAIFVDVDDQQNYVDVDVIADMTLTSDPTNTAYIQGMKEAVAAIKDENEKVIAQNELNEYIAEQMSEYNVADETTFCYRLEIPDLTTYMDDITNYEVFYRTDITEDESILVPVPENPQTVMDLCQSFGHIILKVQ